MGRDGSVEMVELLLEHGADVNLANHRGVTPLFLACLEGSEDIAGILIEGGSDVNATTSRGFTPLFCAAEYELSRVAQQLLAAGAEPDAACGSTREHPCLQPSTSVHPTL